MRGVGLPSPQDAVTRACTTALIERRRSLRRTHQASDRGRESVKPSGGAALVGATRQRPATWAASKICAHDSRTRRYVATSVAPSKMRTASSPTSTQRARAPTRTACCRARAGARLHEQSQQKAKYTGWNWTVPVAQSRLSTKARPLSPRMVAVTPPKWANAAAMPSRQSSWRSWKTLLRTAGGSR